VGCTRKGAIFPITELDEAFEGKEKKTQALALVETPWGKKKKRAQFSELTFSKISKNPNT